MAYRPMSPRFRGFRPLLCSPKERRTRSSSSERRREPTVKSLARPCSLRRRHRFGRGRSAAADHAPWQHTIARAGVVWGRGRASITRCPLVCYVRGPSIVCLVLASVCKCYPPILIFDFESRSRDQACHLNITYKTHMHRRSNFDRSRGWQGRRLRARLRTDATAGRMGRRRLAAVMPLLAAALLAAGAAEAARAKHAPWRPPAYNTSAACW